MTESRDVVRVELVQINTAVDSSAYLPYSVGLLQAYLQGHATRPERYVFGLPVIQRVTPEEGVAALGGADIVGFSTYVWNANRSLAIARALKSAHPDTLVVFGGPHVPDDAEEFLRAHPFIDVACHGEGEQTFLEIAESYPRREWTGVAGTSFIARDGRFVAGPQRERIRDLSGVPSPFLSGVFAPLMAALPDTTWRTVWETNRGCPFACTFCDWGSAIAARVNRFELDRIRSEADWLGAQRVDYVFIGDANFGILPRDVEIAEILVTAARAHGHPRQVLVQQTKNATDRAYATMKTLAEAGLAAEINISIQTTTPEVLEAIRRDNISLDTYDELQRRFVHDGIPTFVDMIVGLPAETPRSFRESVSRVLEGGQHHRVQFHNLTILPNAEMGDPAYQQRYGLRTVTSRIVNNHAAAEVPPDGIFETQEVVIAAASYSDVEWRDMRSFAWLTLLFHLHRLLQLPILVTWQSSGLPLWRVIDALVQADADAFPTLGQQRRFCLEFAERMQAGGDEYVHSAEWLGQFWTVDEHLYISLCLEGRLPALFAEARACLAPLLPPAGPEVDPRVALHDAIRLNEARIRLPQSDGRVVVACEHDVHGFGEAVLRGEHATLVRGPVTYEIEHRPAPDLDAWLLGVVRDRAQDKLAPVTPRRP